MNWSEPARGRDPYDALMGRRIPAFVRRSARLRQVVVQVRKRVPVDLGGLLGVEPFVMAKTLGCFLAADARSLMAGEESEALADGVAALLERRTPEGGWGYEFDVQTRWAYYAAGTPNVIATAFCARGLLTAAAVGSIPAAEEAAMAAARWVADALVREGADGPYVAYTQSSRALVHNANLLGSALMACVGRRVADEALLSQALSCARTSARAQRADGSWPYGEGASLAWADSFHTAYDLDALLLLELATNDQELRSALARGVPAWTSAFFGPNGEPYYLRERRYPYDIHAAATAVDVGARLALHGYDTADVARSVALWARQTLVGPEGRTAYQRHRLWTDRRHFPRWGDGHWRLAEASLGLLDTGAIDPLERSVMARG